MTLCRFESRVADPLAETASSRLVKQLGYLTLLHQACQTLSIVCVALGIGREVSIRLLLSAGHWAPPFQCRPLFGPTVSPRLRSEVPQYAGRPPTLSPSCLGGGFDRCVRPNVLRDRPLPSGECAPFVLYYSRDVAAPDTRCRQQEGVPNPQAIGTQENTSRHTVTVPGIHG